MRNIPLENFIHKATTLLFACLLFNITATQSQTVNQLTKAGDKKFAEGAYYEAALYFEDALKKDEGNASLYYKFAESCRMFNDYERAATAYRATSKLDKANEFPLATFWLGNMLKSFCVCKYDDAIAQFRKFRSKYRKADYYSQKAQQEIESCSWAKDNLQKNDSIKIVHLGKEVNTPQSEFNAVHVYPDRIQFSSLRNISNDKKNEKHLVRIYNQPPNPENIYTPNGADQNLNIGNIAYSSDTKFLFFTQCEQTDKTNTRCDIYESHFDSYQWTKAEKIIGVNDPKFSSTHPVFGKDLSGNDVLFFSSDRNGGQGGMDIWISKRNADGTYSNPINAGTTINTAGNEITPFYDANAAKLFFSSDWHYGFGGYDIFETSGEYTNWSKPKNLMQPINTSQNDLYYSIATDNSKAYITSNRKGSYFIEAETCCNDIYAYETGKKITLNRDSLVVIKKEFIPIKPEDNAVVTIKTPETPRVFVDDKLKKVKQLLPVTLYFHNDQPECCNLRDTTALDYKQTYESYSALLNEYSSKFSKNLSPTDKQKAEQEIFALFNQKVDKGFSDLVAFSSQVLGLLERGNRLEITIKGYCSPLNYNQYNIKLGYRRIASLRNYIFHYREGVLLPYINNGSLVLKSESLGEETAAKTVSDKLEDTRNSVYNPSAAIERRVEIVSVEIK
jgi:outer membrane protein OmpA-like peptidoglycan-associated protein